MISTVIGLIGAIVGLVGWFGFHSVIALFIGTGLYLVETIMEWKSLDGNAKKFDLVIFIIGCIVSLFIPVTWYVCGMIAINIYNGLLSVGGVIQIISFFSK